MYALVYSKIGNIGWEMFGRAQTKPGKNCIVDEINLSSETTWLVFLTRQSMWPHPPQRWPNDLN